MKYRAAGKPWSVPTRRTCRPGLVVMSAFVAVCTATDVRAQREIRPAKREPPKATAVLWRDPGDITKRSLFYGSGGRESEPHGPYVFLEEDPSGTNPKFDVRDRNGVRWQVKLGAEAKPETAAARLVWAVGYLTPEDHFLPELRVEKMPPHLHRGQNLIAPDGVMRDVRLKRHDPHLKKVGLWQWSANPFLHTREFNGLRVVMALINNWDLKDENNSIYRAEGTAGSPALRDLYMVSDLGASFGSTGRSWPASKSKGNLASYHDSTFILRVTPEYVDLNVPTRPNIAYIVTPREFNQRLQLRWIGKHVPRSDVRWVANLLARLSPEQIRTAFRTAGYTPEEAEGFMQALLQRIAQLKRL